MKKFYVYAWYFKSTNKIFYIGKGTGDRCCDVVHSRNNYFKNIINKYQNDVDVKIIEDNMLEKDAFELERRLIREYWNKGECNANFHEGGQGGNTGNYDNPERSRKLSEVASKRIGELHPLYGKHRTEETKQKLREANKGKRLSEEHRQKLIKANTGRKKTEQELEFITNLNKGKKMPESTYMKMMDSLCEFEYIIKQSNEIIYKCLGHTALYKYCKEELHISRTIVDQIVKKEWTPKFEKHKHLQDLIIDKVYRGVSTNRDECSGVE